MSGGAARLDDVAVGALQDVLGTEHAALWSYALAVAFLAPDQVAAARTDAAAHRELRGSDRDHPDPARAAPGVRPAGVRHAAARRRMRRRRPGCW